MPRLTRSAASAALAMLAATAAAWAQDVPKPARHPLTGYAASAEWLQANGGGLHRDALPSYAWSLSRDIGDRGLRLELGYLRAARATSTAKGVSAGLALSRTRGRFTVRPGIAALAGVAETVADGGGYNWRAEGGVSEGDYPDGQAGYQGRPLYTRGTTFGGGLSVAAEARLVAGLSVTGSTRYWVFSGDVLRADRTRFLAGVGLAVRPAELVAAVRGDRQDRPVAASTAQETSK
jgi:hypothetical protein